MSRLTPAALTFILGIFLRCSKWFDSFQTNGLAAPKLPKREAVDTRKLLLECESPLKVCAPMVRFSKLPFRTLVRKYGCDVTYTSMIMADSFRLSATKRAFEFATCVEEPTPVITQFAANTVEDFVGASRYVVGYCDGVDLNCGCPQRWAMQEGYGASLLQSPQKIFGMVREFHNQVCPDTSFSVSVKLRLLPLLNETVDLFRQIESTGVSFVGIHARTHKMRNEPAEHEQLAEIIKSLQVPVIANGDCFSLKDYSAISERTRARGVMAARGLLENPALFAGYDATPLCCVEDFITLCIKYGFNFVSFKKLFYWMIERNCSKSERLNIISCQSMAQFLDYFRDNFDCDFDAKLHNTKLGLSAETI